MKFEVNSLDDLRTAVFEAVQRRIISFSFHSTFPEFDRHIDELIAHHATRIAPDIGAGCISARRAWFHQLQLELLRSNIPT